MAANGPYLGGKRPKELGFCGLLFIILCVPCHRFSRDWRPYLILMPKHIQQAHAFVAFYFALDTSLTFLSNALMVAVPLPADPVPL